MNIRGVPDGVHEELKRIASESGVILNSLVVDEWRPQRLAAGTVSL
jgi:hypothetical protein